MDRNGGCVLLADVARLAGVSLSTASIALRPGGKINPGTRETVRKVAHEMGYQPNLAAAILARRRIEGILPNVPVAVLGMGTRHRYRFPNTSFVSALTEHACRRGFLVEEPEPDYPSVTRLLKVLYHRGIKGVVLNIDFNTALISPEDAKPFSFLMHGRLLEKSPFHSVGSEIFEGTRILW